MIYTGDLMISFVRVYIIAGLILLSFNAESQNYRLEKAWETEPVFSTPESAVFDANRDQIYISNFNTFPRDLESPGFLNDIAIDEKGVIYFTDTSPKKPEASAVYAFRDGSVDTIASDPVNRSNGLLCDRRSLLVGNSGDQSLKKIDLETNEVHNVARMDTGIIDGIKNYKNEYYIVTLWEGRIYLINSDGIVKELLDVRSSNIRTADIEFIPELNLIVIPTFDYNRVIAYRIKE